MSTKFTRHVICSWLSEADKDESGKRPTLWELSFQEENENSYVKMERINVL